MLVPSTGHRRTPGGHGSNEAWAGRRDDGGARGVTGGWGSCLGGQTALQKLLTNRGCRLCSSHCNRDRRGADRADTRGNMRLRTRRLVCSGVIVRVIARVIVDLAVTVTDHVYADQR